MLMRIENNHKTMSVTHWSDWRAVEEITYSIWIEISFRYISLSKIKPND